MQLAPDCRFTILPIYGFLAVEGERAVEFLQAQLTCDLRGADPGQALSAAWCNIKGRVIASMLLRVPESGPVLLRMRADLGAETASQMARYAALSRVKLSPEPGWTCIGVYGASARDVLEHSIGQSPAGRLAVAEASPDTLVLQRDEAGHMFELWVTTAESAALRTRLAERAASGGSADWLRGLIEAGIAEVQSRTRDMFLPQMLAYDADGTVSFRKGCYPGQEVVARAHYRGAVKRGLALLCGAPGPCPEPGEPLHAGERVVGHVVEAAPADDGSAAVLAVVSQDVDAEILTAQGLRLDPVRTPPVL